MASPYYNSPFPATYQPYYPQYQQQMPQTQQAQPNNFQNGNSSIIWVQGEAGAKSYLVAPNSTVQLWDSESQTIYLKSADASGMPSMRILDYTIRQNAPQTAPAGVPAQKADYPTREEFNALQSLVEGLKSKLELKGDSNEQSALQ